MKPVILITTKFKADDFSVGGLLYTPRNYCEAIIRAGGIPVILPALWPLSFCLWPRRTAHGRREERTADVSPSERAQTLP